MAIGFLLSIIQPPMILVFLAISGMFAFRGWDRPRGHKYLAVTGGLGAVTCSMVVLDLTRP
jgi:hypothetical protein